MSRWRALERRPFRALIVLTRSGVTRRGGDCPRSQRKGRSAVKSSHAIGAAAVALMLSAAALSGQAGAHYRDFQLGSTLASVSGRTGVSASEAKTLHERPAILQDLQWRRPYAISSGTTDAPDPVQQIAFSFYDDQLFRLVIDYDRDRTQGLTDADIIDAISGMYGPTVTASGKSTRAGTPQIDTESGTRVAGWGDGEYTAVLYRSSYASGFRLVVTSTRLSALARGAEAQALRLEEREAPQRERARQKKEAEDARAVQQKARLANKAAFIP
jgi:hypothetical protein